MKKYLGRFILAGFVLIVLVGLVIYRESIKDKALGYWGNSFRATSTAYNTTVGLSLLGGTTTATGLPAASSTQVLAANDNRQFARCQNTNINGYPVSLMLGSTATSSTLYSGYIISPMASTSYAPSFIEFDLNNQYAGAIYAYAQSTSTIHCVEN